MCVCAQPREGYVPVNIVLFLMYSDCERWSFCARLVVCTVATCLEWTFCMTKFHEFSVTPVSYYLRHIVMIYFSPHGVMFVVGCKTITPEAVHISYRTWGGIKQYMTRTGQTLRVPWVWGSQISREFAHEGGKVVSPTHRLTLPQGKIFLILISVKRLSRPQGHSATGRIMPMNRVWHWIIIGRSFERNLVVSLHLISRLRVVFDDVLRRNIKVSMRLNYFYRNWTDFWWDDYWFSLWIFKRYRLEYREGLPSFGLFSDHYQKFSLSD